MIFIETVAKFGAVLFPALKVSCNLWSNIREYGKYVIPSFASIAPTAGRYAVITRRASSPGYWNKVFYVLVSLLFAVGARPVEITQGLQPFFQGKCSLTSVFSSRIKLLDQYFVYPFVLTLIAVFTYLFAGIYAVQDKSAVTNNACLLVFGFYCLGAIRMIETSNRRRNILFSKSDHIKTYINSAAQFTQLWLFEIFLDFPFPITHNLVHDDSKEKTPSQRGQARHKEADSIVSEMCLLAQANQLIAIIPQK